MRRGQFSALISWDAALTPVSGRRWDAILTGSV